MTTEELTQIVLTHQQILSAQQLANTRQESRLDRIEAILDRVAQQQEASQQASQERFARIEATIEQNNQQHQAGLERLAKVEAAIAQIHHAIALNREDVAQLMVGIGELRNQVAD